MKRAGKTVGKGEGRQLPAEWQAEEYPLGRAGAARVGTRTVWWRAGDGRPFVFARMTLPGRLDEGAAAYYGEVYRALVGYVQGKLLSALPAEAALGDPRCPSVTLRLTVEEAPDGLHWQLALRGSGLCPDRALAGVDRWANGRLVSRRPEGGSAPPAKGRKMTK